MKPAHTQKIIILGTGGTIAGKAAHTSDVVNYTAGLVGIEQLLDSARPLIIEQEHLVLEDVELISEQLVQLDSKDMSFSVWKKLLNRCEYWLSQSHIKSMVITHGTDTLEETAYFLQAVLKTTKPVVITCAMRPSTAIDADGPQNLRDAIAVAANVQANAILVVCAGDVHHALDVQKVHTTRLNAFSSGDADLYGRFIDGKLKLSVNALKKPAQQTQESKHLSFSDFVKVEHPPRVEIILNHADANGDIVEALLQQNASQTQKLRGIVVAGTGNGTISESLEAKLLKAQESGVVIWRSTRCAFGALEGRANALFGDSHGLTPVKARIALMLKLMCLDLIAMKS